MSSLSVDEIRVRFEFKLTLESLVLFWSILNHQQEQALVAVAVKDQPRNRLSNEQVTSLAMDDGNYLVPNDTPGPSATAIQYPSAMLTNSTSQPSTGSSQSQTQTPHRTTPPGNQSQDQTRFADNITTNNRNLSTSSNRGEEGATTSDVSTMHSHVL